MPEFNEEDAEIVYFSGKRAEEIGFQKFHRRQAKLQGIRVLVLDHLQIQHRVYPSADEDAISELCADITDLDLSGNLFETFDEILRLCKLLPKLKVLTLDGNRFAVDFDKHYTPLPLIHTLHLSQTLLNQTEINALKSETAAIFPNLISLRLTRNEYEGSLTLHNQLSLSSVDLSDNKFTALSDVVDLSPDCPHLQTLVLKRNQISRVENPRLSGTEFCAKITELDLSYNAISEFDFFNNVNPTTFPKLKHLRVTGNPLYGSLVSAEGKPLATEDGYMLTTARLPQIESLNYRKITEKERLNAETYYLGQIAAELTRTPGGQEEKVLAKHPRYRELCEEYGEPNIQRKVGREELDPNSLAAKLVAVTFSLSDNVSPDTKPRSWTDEIPKSFNIYAVLGMVGKRLNAMPLGLRLILETNEKDPVGKDSAYVGPEWWDSSDDEAEMERENWVKRQVELVAGTRALGTFVEAREASVRVDVHGGDL